VFNVKVGRICGHLDHCLNFHKLAAFETVTTCCAEHEPALASLGTGPVQMLATWFRFILLSAPSVKDKTMTQAALHNLKLSTFR
jgi:hypothetical protein